MGVRYRRNAMDPRLRAVVEEVKERALSNPPEAVESALRLQQTLYREGLIDTFNEGELGDAAVELGVDEDHLTDFFEQLASWD